MEKHYIDRELIMFKYPTVEQTRIAANAKKRFERLQNSDKWKYEQEKMRKLQEEYLANK